MGRLDQTNKPSHQNTDTIWLERAPAFPSTKSSHSRLMRDENMQQCKEAAINVFDFASFFVFQGLTHMEFVYPNTTDISIYKPLLNMINTSVIDTLSTGIVDRVTVFSNDLYQFVPKFIFQIVNNMNKIHMAHANHTTS